MKVDSSVWIAAVLAWTMITFCHESLAQSGEVQVFDPDPVTALGDTTLRDNSHPKRFSEAYVIKTVPEISKTERGTYQLQSANVVIGDFELPTNEMTESVDGRFIFERGEQGFRDAMAFYHLDANVRYVQSLGFEGEAEIGNTPLKVDTNALYGDRGAYYVPSENLILLGTGCIDAAEDADELHRMFFYSVLNAVQPDLRGGDTSAIIEALADYWAVSRSLDAQVGSEDFATGIFQWSSQDGCGFPRSVDKSKVRYNPEENYYGNQSIPGGVSNQLISVPLFEALMEGESQGLQKQQLDRLVLQSLSTLENGMTIRQYGMKFLNLVKSAGYSQSIWRTFVIRFQHKEILPSSVVEVFDTKFSTEDGKPISRGSLVTMDFKIRNSGDLTAKGIVMALEVVNDNIEVVKGTWKKGRLKGKSKTIEGQLIFRISSGPICDQGGVVFGYSLKYGDLYNQTQSSQDVKFEVWNYIESKTVEQPIPDLDINGLVSEVTVNSPAKNFDLLLDLDITHTRRGDLLVTIEHPSGLKKTLWYDKENTNEDLKGTYPTTLLPKDSLEELLELSALGVWKLTVSDVSFENNGVLNSWGLRLKNGICD